MKGTLAVAAIVILLGVSLYLAREPILLAIGDYLVIEDELHPADVIHVIAGPDNRTDYAIHLYNEGYGRTLFFTGGWCETHSLYHGQHGRERALAQGVSPEAIVIDDTEVTSTYAEALRLRELITQSEMPIRSVIVVSDPYHMRRARWTYRRVLGEQIAVQMAPVPFAFSCCQRRWWIDKASSQYVGQEYLKMVYYLVRYQISCVRLNRYWLR